MSALTTLLDEGIVIVQSLLTPIEVQMLRACMDALRTEGVPTTQQVLYTHELPPSPRPSFERLFEQWFNPHSQDGQGSTRLLLDRLGGRLADKLASGLFAFQDVLLSKQAEHAALPWHQDQPFWPIETPWAAVVWCALDPIERERGGVEFAVGSHHRLGPAIDLHTGAPQNAASTMPFESTGFEICCPVLAPGDVVVFHGRTWHRSGINHVGLPRRAWISTWLPREARWNPAQAPRHSLARSAVAGTFVHHTRRSS